VNIFLFVVFILLTLLAGVGLVLHFLATKKGS
jgi:hypothetical protein